jgi:hypothetical protein
MRLYAKSIINFSNINSLDYVNQWTIRAKEANVLYFQLVDLDRSGLRYMAGSGVINQPASVLVTFPSIDDSQVITLTASQESDDKSIWSVSLNANQLPASGNVIFTIIEGANTRKFSAMNLINVEYPEDSGMC